MNTTKIVPITGSVIISANPYKGEYDLIPSRKTQILQTANKTLTKDITVLSIPYSKVSNTAGGTTFYIAKEN